MASFNQIMPLPFFANDAARPEVQEAWLHYQATGEIRPILVSYLPQKLTANFRSESPDALLDIGSFTTMFGKANVVEFTNTRVLIYFHEVDHRDIPSAVFEKALCTFHDQYGKHATVIAGEMVFGFFLCTAPVALELLKEEGYFLLVKTVVPAPMPTLKNGKSRVPRPRNQFLIYRQWQSGNIRENVPGITAGEVSTKTAKLWQVEVPEVKLWFKYLADREDAAHKLKYPGYKYTSRRAPQHPASRAPDRPHDIIIADPLDHIREAVALDL